jgi:hypothetical protein
MPAWGDHCSALYLGSYNGSSTAKNFKIYANTIEKPQCEGVDIKPASHNNEIHHNIFNDVGSGTTNGTSASGSPNTGVVAVHRANNIHNNIFRRFKVRTYAGCVSKFSSNTGARFHQNVCRDSLSPSIAVGGANGGSGIEVDHNTWCNLNSSSILGGVSVYLHDNKGLPAPNASSSTCDAEEARILADRNALPGNPGGSTASTINLPPAPSGLAAGAVNP